MSLNCFTFLHPGPALSCLTPPFKFLPPAALQITPPEWVNLCLYLHSTVRFEREWSTQGNVHVHSEQNGRLFDKLNKCRTEGGKPLSTSGVSFKAPLAAGEKRVKMEAAGHSRPLDQGARAVIVSEGWWLGNGERWRGGVTPASSLSSTRKPQTSHTQPFRCW